MSLTDTDRARFDDPDFTPEKAEAGIFKLRRKHGDEAAAAEVLKLRQYATEFGGTSRESFRRARIAQAAALAMRTDLS